MKFTVTNPDGSKPDFEQIIQEDWIKEKWLPVLFVHSEKRFALQDDGALMLIQYPEQDFRLCPPDRFTVHFEEEK